VRDKRKEVVKAVERAFEGVKPVVGETVEKRLSFVASSKSVTGGRVDAPVAVDNAADVGQFIPAQSQVTVTVSGQESSPAEGPISESNTLVVSADATATLHAEPSRPHQLNPILDPPLRPQLQHRLQLTVAEPESTERQVPAEEVETVGPFVG
jgi:hypothetical protein